MDFKISGTITDINTQQGAENLKIEAWDKDFIYDDFVGADMTNSDGKFTIKFDEYYYRELFIDHWPDLYFKVFHGNDLLTSTEDNILWNIMEPETEVNIEVTVPVKEIDWTERHIYLKIERIENYSPVKPQEKASPPREYGRDCVRNEGHENGIIPDSEVEARSMTAITYREYLDAAYLIPKTSKLINADINEPVYDRRVPGTVIYAYPHQRLKIHVWNCDTLPHSFHIHGLEYGIDSDGAWPFGVETEDGRRSDEICPNQTWTYTYEVHKEMVGAWPFHDHAQPSHMRISQGVFGGMVILSLSEKPPANPFQIPDILVNNMFKDLGILELKQKPHFKLLNRTQRILLENHYDFFEEYLEKEFHLPRPRLARTDHVPVFFHLMSSGEAKPLFDSRDLEELVGVYEHPFNEEGIFDYFCSFHPDMTGKVHVIAGGPAIVTVNIVDGPPMGFSPDMITVGIGGTVRWENHSIQHHTVTSKEGASIPTHCINGRGFVGNSPTIEAPAGQRIRWYVFNLDTSENWHNFHPHAMRWKFADQALDIRSMGPAESFVVEAKIPPVLLLDDEMKKIQDPENRPKKAKLYRLKGEYVFHCHVHHHMRNGMIGIVRSKQSVWLTDEMVEQLKQERGFPLDNGLNACPDVDMDRCSKKGEGVWEEVAGDPEVTFMHSMLLPKTKKVLYWGYTKIDQSRIWDHTVPAGTYSLPTNQPADLPGLDINSSNLWSAEHTFLDTPEGHILANGGFTPNRSFLFNPATESWEETNATVDNRFYSTTMTLGDGRAITLFGSASKSIEAYTPGVGWSAPVLMPVGYIHHQYYPWTYLLPDGKLFISGPHVPTQRFEWDNPAVFDSYATIGGNRSTGGEKGSSLMLVLRPPSYEPVVLIMGGNTATTEKTSEIIDLSVGAPSWSALPDLNVARPSQFTSILLPDGRVFIAGGVSGLADGGPVEIYDPQNPLAGWQLGANMTYQRGYHSSFILLSDGSILAGGDPKGPGGVFTPHERFYPDYFTVPRPSITNAPETINFGSNVTVETPEAADINEVILLRPGAVTHGYNMSQRALELEIIATGANSLDVTIPANVNLAPPGWHLLFILDSNRIPSEGRWIRLTS